MERIMESPLLAFEASTKESFKSFNTLSAEKKGQKVVILP